MKKLYDEIDAIVYFENNYRDSLLYKKLLYLCMDPDDAYLYMKENAKFKYNLLKEYKEYLNSINNNHEYDKIIKQVDFIMQDGSYLLIKKVSNESLKEKIYKIK